MVDTKYFISSLIIFIIAFIVITVIVVSHENKIMARIDGFVQWQGLGPVRTSSIRTLHSIFYVRC